MKNGCYLNVDPDTMGYIFCGCHGDLSNLQDKLDLYLEGYKDHGIEHLLFNIFCQNSIVPTSVVEFAADNYDKKIEGGLPVDYTNEPHTIALHEAVKHIPDPIGYLINKSKAEGYKTWLSYRMNDCHGSHATNFCGRSKELYYRAKEEGAFIGDHVAGRYYGECLDYSKDFVRSTMLAYIKETLEKYDVYGIELDFMREIFCFDYEKTPNCREIMTDFISEVKKLLTEAEKKWNHPLKLLVRLARDIKNNYIFGFDVKDWINKGLVDVLVPTSRWDDTDSDMPISEWVALTENTGVEISAGLEYYLKGRINISEECANALTAQYIDDGASSVYLYNYYRESVPLPDMTEWYKNRPGFVLYDEEVEKRVRDGGFEFWDFDAFLKLDSAKSVIWDICSNPERAKAAERRHVMTYTEPCLVPRGGNTFAPLPVTVNGTHTFEKLTGKISDRKATLYLGVASGDTPPTVTVDGKEAHLIGKTDDAYYKNPKKESATTGYENTDFYAYKITADGETRRKISVTSNGARLEYLEIKVEKA